MLGAGPVARGNGGKPPAGEWERWERGVVADSEVMPPSAVPPPPPPSGPRDRAGDNAAALAELAEDYHRLQMSADPLLATYYGLDVHRDRLPDLTEAGRGRVRDDTAALRHRVGRIDPSRLSPTEETSRVMLLRLMGDDLAALDGRWSARSVDDFAFAPSAELLYHLGRTQVLDDGHGHAHVRRLAAVGAFLDGALEEHRRAVADRMTPTARGVAEAVERVRRVAVTPAGTSPLLAPLSDRGPLVREQAANAYREVVVPALHRYADGLQRDVAPSARPDDRAGLCWTDDGAEVYGAMLSHFTTLDRPDPAGIHQQGLAIVAALQEEIAEVGQRLLGLSDPAAITERLLNDPSLDYADPSEIVPHAQAIFDRAAEAAGAVIGRLPTTPCIVKPVPEDETGAGAAFYDPPTPARPHGIYWVNIVDPRLHRYEAEATAFHEAAPGHHTQLGLQAELDLPAFRRIGTFLSGYGEGWGLYTERLADELGWYSGDLDRLGMLATDMMRACRLVLDTGLHHHGWSRQQAIEWFTAHAPLSAELIVSEVDRYIVYPGQACSYMLGRLEIQRLRAAATRQLGGRFDLSGFHDTILGEGAVPLAALQPMVDRWVDSRAQPTVAQGSAQAGGGGG